MTEDSKDMVRPGTTPERVTELLRLLESAAKGSRKLDALISALVDERPAWAARSPEALVAHENGHISLGKNGAGWEASRFTSETDAAIMLVALHKPDWCGMLSLCIAGSTQAQITALDACDSRAVEAVCPTPALAVCAVLLKALLCAAEPDAGDSGNPSKGAAQ